MRSPIVSERYHRLRIVISPRSLCHHPEVLADLIRDHEVEISPGTLPGSLDDVDVIVLGNEQLDENRISAATQLKYIIRYGTGTENIDLSAARRRGIAVSRCPDTASVAVAEYIFGAALFLCKRFGQFHDATEVVAQSLLPEDMSTKTFGILGSVAAFASELDRIQIVA